jgi:hypothetical protein
MLPEGIEGRESMFGSTGKTMRRTPADILKGSMVHPDTRSAKMALRSSDYDSESVRSQNFDSDEREASLAYYHKDHELASRSGVPITHVSKSAVRTPGGALKGAAARGQPLVVTVGLNHRSAMKSLVPPQKQRDLNRASQRYESLQADAAGGGIVVKS